MHQVPRNAYPTDLTDSQWNILQPLLPVKTCKGRNQEVDLRDNSQRHFLLASYRMSMAKSSP